MRINQLARRAKSGWTAYSWIHTAKGRRAVSIFFCSAKKTMRNTMTKTTITVVTIKNVSTTSGQHTRSAGARTYAALGRVPLLAEERTQVARARLVRQHVQLRRRRARGAQNAARGDARAALLRGISGGRHAVHGRRGGEGGGARLPRAGTAGRARSGCSRRARSRARYRFGLCNRRPSLRSSLRLRRRAARRLR